MLTLRGISKTFNQLHALHPTDLAVQPGKTTVLIGPSGCGKSTLLRLMIGLIPPDTGTVLFDDAAVTENNVLTIRTKMGYVIQDGGLFPHLSARDNIVLMARYLKWDARRIQERLDMLIDLTRFPGDALDRFPVQISGGQRQRVSLMRALMLDPDVLLLDEPLGALDPMIRYELQKDLRRIFQTLEKTVVLVTHDLSEARFFSDVIILLNEGRVIQQGDFAAFLEKPADPFVTRFIHAQRHPLDPAGDEK